MLVLSRKKNESIIIGDNIEVRVVDIRGDQVKIGISAPPQIKIYREEVYRAIQEENRSALSVSREIPSLDDLLGDDVP
ncbi:carbon storage regulator, CsrA [Spirochaeta thermophila DSM 6578]|uniref:Translational regulator CsrA n=1 Tax=Winmispira thermophila (strain ATCC 700085 / DSM 6578 / Z-1203) TaxID=869211 RepID=G0GFX2_WINT7|nr:carbon storage regulator CsrA [Spirochaeta thermophila]AEJ61665.1 carbon storage regulator, CsrA [Spirochaeta thermophila DSM 6578]